MHFQKKKFNMSFNLEIAVIMNDQSILVVATKVTCATVVATARIDLPNKLSAAK